MISGPLTLAQFLATLRDRYVERTGMEAEACDPFVIGAIEAWEDGGEAIDLSEACAHAIADEDLAAWEPA